MLVARAHMSLQVSGAHLTVHCGRKQRVSVGVLRRSLTALDLSACRLHRQCFSVLLAVGLVSCLSVALSAEGPGGQYFGKRGAG